MPLGITDHGIRWAAKDYSIRLHFIFNLIWSQGKIPPVSKFAVFDKSEVFESNAIYDIYSAFLHNGGGPLSEGVTVQFFNDWI